MKLTKSKLKEIIKEEIKLLKEDTSEQKSAHKIYNAVIDVVDSFDPTDGSGIRVDSEWFNSTTSLGKVSYHLQHIRNRVSGDYSENIKGVHDNWPKAKKYLLSQLDKKQKYYQKRKETDKKKVNAVDNIVRGLK